MKDTIVAPATAAGTAAVGILRLSGEDALSVAAKVFAAKGWSAETAEPYRMYLGKADAGNFADKAFCMYCKAPKSYTGEDVVEFHLHGGKVVLDGLLRRLVALGARPALPGEFTKRAYLNGKLDLAEAEGIEDMISAGSEAEAMQAYRMMGGEVSKGIERVKEFLIEAAANIDAVLDYPEELTDDNMPLIEAALTEAKAELTRLYEGSKDRRMLKEGLSLVLAGLTNVGKSSLMNALLRDDRAIVTDIAGTTRDVLRESFELEGVTINVSDTAGIREGSDEVERIGIARAERAIEGADLVIFVTDCSVPESEEERALYAKIRHKKHIRVANKGDAEKYPREADIVTEAKTGANIDALTALIADKLELKKRLETPILTRERQIFAVKAAADHVDSALGAIGAAGLDCLAVDVKAAWAELCSLTGEDVAESVVDEIFSRFCVGK